MTRNRSTVEYPSYYPKPGVNQITFDHLQVCKLIRFFIIHKTNHPAKINCVEFGILVFLSFAYVSDLAELSLKETRHTI